MTVDERVVLSWLRDRPESTQRSIRTRLTASEVHRTLCGLLVDRMVVATKRGREQRWSLSDRGARALRFEP